LKNSFSAADHNFAAPWRRRHKKDAGDQRDWRKIRRKPPQSIISGIEREKSLAIEFGRIFKAPNFSSFSTQSAESGLPLGAPSFKVIKPNIVFAQLFAHWLPLRSESD
jgi:hypothetical protein